MGPALGMKGFGALCGFTLSQFVQRLRLELLISVQNVGTALSLLNVISQEVVTYHEYAVYAYPIRKKKGVDIS